MTVSVRKREVFTEAEMLYSDTIQVPLLLANINIWSRTILRSLAAAQSVSALQIIISIPLRMFARERSHMRLCFFFFFCPDLAFF